VNELCEWGNFFQNGLVIQLEVLQSAFALHCDESDRLYEEPRLFAFIISLIDIQTFLQLQGETVIAGANDLQYLKEGDIVIRPLQ